MRYIFFKNHTQSGLLTLKCVLVFYSKNCSKTYFWHNRIVVLSHYFFAHHTLWWLRDSKSLSFFTCFRVSNFFHASTPCWHIKTCIVELEISSPSSYVVANIYNGRVNTGFRLLKRYCHSWKLCKCLYYILHDSPFLRILEVM